MLILAASAKVPLLQTMPIYMWGGLLLIILVGLALAIYGYWEIREARASASWPSTQGKVIASSVEVTISTEEEDDDGVGRNRNGRTRTRTVKVKRYEAKVIYSYAVGGVDYTGDRVAFGDMRRGDPAFAEEVVARYPVGAEVPVYYKPGKPKRCLLEKGDNDQTWLLPLVGLLFFALPLLWAAGYAIQWWLR